MYKNKKTGIGRFFCFLELKIFQKRIHFGLEVKDGFAVAVIPF